MLYFSFLFVISVHSCGDSKELLFVCIPHQFILTLIEQYAILII